MRQFIDSRNPKDGMIMLNLRTEGNVTPHQVETNLKMAYLKSRRSPDTRVLEGFMTVLAHFRKDNLTIPVLLQETSDIIRTLFTLRYVMIGLKGRDGKYRYERMSGMRDDTWAVNRKKEYTLESFSIVVPGWYSAGVISDLTRVYLQEKNPLGPEYESSVNRPALLSMRRSSIESSLEADYFNALIKGPRDELIGWIEYSGTVGGKLPDASVIRNIEVFASILAAAIACQEMKGRTP